jgi:hypothetical protein
MYGTMAVSFLDDVDIVVIVEATVVVVDVVVVVVVVDVDVVVLVDVRVLNTVRMALAPPSINRNALQLVLITQRLVQEQHTREKDSTDFF